MLRQAGKMYLVVICNNFQGNANLFKKLAHIFLRPFHLRLPYGNQFHQLPGKSPHPGSLGFDNPSIFNTAFLWDVLFNLEQVRKPQDGSQGRLHFMGKVINELFPILCHIL